MWAVCEILFNTTEKIILGVSVCVLPAECLPALLSWGLWHDEVLARSTACHHLKQGQTNPDSHPRLWYKPVLGQSGIKNNRLGHCPVAKSSQAPAVWGSKLLAVSSLKMGLNLLVINLIYWRGNSSFTINVDPIENRTLHENLSAKGVLQGSHYLIHSHSSDYNLSISDCYLFQFTTH